MLMRTKQAFSNKRLVKTAVAPAGAPARAGAPLGGGPNAY